MASDFNPCPAFARSQACFFSPRCFVHCTLLLLVVAFALVLSCSVQALEPVTVRSQSGQFIVRGLPRGAPLSGYVTSVVDYVRLDPTITAIALERIRQAVFG